MHQTRAIFSNKQNPSIFFGHHQATGHNSDDGATDTMSKTAGTIDSGDVGEGGVQDRDSHILILDNSLRHLTGRGMLERIRDVPGYGKDHISSLGDAAWVEEVHTNMRFAILSYTPYGFDGPLQNYGNFAALSAYRMPWKYFVQAPAGRTATPGLDQEVWEQVIEQTKEGGKGPGGVCENHKGFRCTGDGDQIPFFIRDAVVSFHSSSSIDFTCIF